MRIIHNGYALTAYGASNMTISDREGRVVYETDKRPTELNEEKDFANYLKHYVKESGQSR